MADVKWIKITTDMFDNRKIKYLRKLPDGNNIVLIWVMLLTMAGRCNSGGMIFLTENIPYTTKLLADELDFEENTVILAIKALTELGMVETDGDFFTIAGWEKYQNIQGLEIIKEQNRNRKRLQRERQKQAQLPNVSRDCHVTVTGQSQDSHAIEEDKEGEKEKEERERKEREKDGQQIVDLFNSLCPSLPSVKIISAKTKKDLADLLTRYTIDDFKQLFTKVEASAFLKGENERKWQATFDWLIREENMAKVLNGNFDERKTARDFELEAWERWQMEKLRNPPKTAAEDESIRERADALREQFKKE